MIREGKVRLNGKTCRNPESPVILGRDQVEVDGANVAQAPHICLALNKPRGLVTTASDEKGRETVFRCLDGADLPHLSPVGRLDQASEGLLLLTNDTALAHTLTHPQSKVEKCYHVQASPPATQETLAQLRAGIRDGGELLSAASVRILRAGAKTCWLECILTEGRNRQLRRMLAAVGLEVLRLVRTRIGPLELGNLPKGAWRRLSPEELAGLHAAAKSARP
jgi:23S rRNA pseudouridine2605 synthase